MNVMTVAMLRSILARFPEDEKVIIYCDDFEHGIGKIVYEIEPDDEGRVVLHTR